MSEYRLTQKHVTREVFNRVSDRIQNHKDIEVKVHNTVYYNGTNLYGDLTIEGFAGYGDAYKEAVRIFTEEYAK